MLVTLRLTSWPFETLLVSTGIGLNASTWLQPYADLKFDACRAGDGDLDDSDIELLEQLLPPEPRADWDRIVAFLTKEQGYIKTVFRWYALQGTVGSDDVEDMGSQQFLKFAKEIKLINKKALPAHVVDGIFIRANQDRSEGVDFWDRYAGFNILVTAQHCDRMS